VSKIGLVSKFARARAKFHEWKQARPARRVSSPEADLRRSARPGQAAIHSPGDFYFYFRQAEQRLQRPGAARISRLLVDRFWGPVGSGEQGGREIRFLATYLFGDEEGRAAARKVDETIRRLPGFATVRLLEAWLDRHVGDRHALNGGRYGYAHR
jgi:hypothetical protein